MPYSKLFKKRQIINSKTRNQIKLCIVYFQRCKIVRKQFYYAFLKNIAEK